MKEITITANGATKIYDGTPLTSEDYTLAGTLDESDQLDVTTGGGQVHFGKSPNVIDTFKITDQGGNDVTGNYAITTNDGMLSVTKRDITLQSATLTKEYDGTALTAHSQSGGTAITDLTAGQTDKGYVSGEEFTYNQFSGSQLFVGSTNNVFVVSDSAKASTSDYNVTQQFGQLIVTARTVPLTITVNDQERPYDGTAKIDASAYTVEGELAYGDTITVTLTNKDGSVNAGTYVDGITATYKIMHGDVDVTDMYANVTVNAGDLTVTPAAPITITADSNSKMYDGTALTDSGYTYEGTLYAGDELSVTVTGSITDFGTAANKVTGYKIVNAAGEDVTSSYAQAVLIDGTLSITKRDVVLTSGDATKKYDGTPLTNHNVTVTGSGFVEGEGATYSNFASQTRVGSAYNAFDYKFNEGTKADNYTISTAKGTLTVTKNDTPITVTAKSAEKMYDGTQLNEGGYTVSGKLAAGDYFASVTVVGELTHYGTAANTVYSWVIMHDNGDGTSTDVTDCYTNITTIDGTLSITKRDVTLTSGDATKEYDGTPLTNKNITVTGSGFVAGEGATYDVIGSQTEIGQSANVFSYNLNEGTSKDDYAITTVEGALTVEPSDPIVVGPGVAAVIVEDHETASTTIGRNASLTLKEGAKLATDALVLNGGKLDVTDGKATVGDIVVSAGRFASEIVGSVDAMKGNSSVTVERGAKLVLDKDMYDTFLDWRRFVSDGVVTVKASDGNALTQDDIQSLTSLNTVSAVDFQQNLVDLNRITFNKYNNLSVGYENAYGTKRNDSIVLGASAVVTLGSAGGVTDLGDGVSDRVSVGSNAVLNFNGTLKSVESISVLSGTKATVGGARVQRYTYAAFDKVDGTQKLSVGNYAEVALDSYVGTAKADTISIGTASEFAAAGNVALGAGNDRVTVGARAKATVGGTLSGVQTLNVAAGKATDVTAFAAGGVAATDGADRIAFGNYSDVKIGTFDFGLGADRLTVGANASAYVGEARFDVLDGAKADDVITVGAGSTLVFKGETDASIKSVSLANGVEAYVTSELYDVFATKANLKKADVYDVGVFDDDLKRAQKITYTLKADETKAFDGVLFGLADTEDFYDFGNQQLVLTLVDKNGKALENAELVAFDKDGNEVAAEDWGLIVDGTDITRVAVRVAGDVADYEKVAYSIVADSNLIPKTLVAVKAADGNTITGNRYGDFYQVGGELVDTVLSSEIKTLGGDDVLAFDKNRVWDVSKTFDMGKGNDTVTTYAYSYVGTTPATETYTQLTNDHVRTASAYKLALTPVSTVKLTGKTFASSEELKQFFTDAGVENYIGQFNVSQDATHSLTTVSTYVTSKDPLTDATIEPTNGHLAWGTVEYAEFTTAGDVLTLAKGEVEDVEGYKTVDFNGTAAGQKVSGTFEGAKIAADGNVVTARDFAGMKTDAFTGKVTTGSFAGAVSITATEATATFTDNKNVASLTSGTLKRSQGGVAPTVETGFESVDFNGTLLGGGVEKVAGNIVEASRIEEVQTAKATKVTEVTGFTGNLAKKGSETQKIVATNATASAGDLFTSDTIELDNGKLADLATGNTALKTVKDDAANGVTTTEAGAIIEAAKDAKLTVTVTDEKAFEIAKEAIVANAAGVATATGNGLAGTFKTYDTDKQSFVWAKNGDDKFAAGTFTGLEKIVFHESVPEALFETSIEAKDVKSVGKLGADGTTKVTTKNLSAVNYTFPGTGDMLSTILNDAEKGAVITLNSANGVIKNVWDEKTSTVKGTDYVNAKLGINVLGGEYVKAFTQGTIEVTDGEKFDSVAFNGNKDKVTGTISKATAADKVVTASKVTALDGFTGSINFGSEDDLMTLGSSDSYDGNKIDFAAGSDTLTLKEGVTFKADLLDFGAGNDTLTANESITATKITNVETVSVKDAKTLTANVEVDDNLSLKGTVVGKIEVMEVGKTLTLTGDASVSDGVSGFRKIDTGTGTLTANVTTTGDLEFRGTVDGTVKGQTGATLMFVTKSEVTGDISGFDRIVLNGSFEAEIANAKDTAITASDAAQTLVLNGTSYGAIDLGGGGDTLKINEADTKITSITRVQSVEFAADASAADGTDTLSYEGYADQNKVAVSKTLGATESLDGLNIGKIDLYNKMTLNINGTEVSGVGAWNTSGWFTYNSTEYEYDRKTGVISLASI